MERSGNPDNVAVHPAHMSRQWWMRWGIAAIVLIAVAHMADEWVWAHVRDVRINDKDIGRFFRSFGYLPTYLVIAGALWLHDRGAPKWGWRGGLVLLAPIAGGAAAEILKMAFRRLRPAPDVFAYVFRPFSDELLSTRGLGLPSSHTMVAFAGATMLARLFPKAWWVFYLTAAGCALTRVLAVGHFLSDTVVGALAGFVVGHLLSQTRAFAHASVHRVPPA